jgi:phosphatidate cytidylyltransferase
MGRRKLIPHISPAKTWEGLAGGILGAVVAAMALSGLLKLSILAAALLGLALCAAAVAGDLAESLIKRAAGVKDSGAIIPGHGGVLDRIDSILFVLVTVYWFATLNT